MKNDKYIKFKCLEISQPIGTFYIGAMLSSDLLSISYADIRRIQQRDIERVVGIQRNLVPRRVKEIQQYVNNIDASFPTSVILAIDSTHAKYNPKLAEMQLLREQQIAQIIDGQHRIAGLEGYEGKFDVNVTIFIDMDLQDKAMTFATINLAQTKVNKSLVYDLYAFQKSRSPQKTCHQIARLLNREEKSPLHGRIKLLGAATGEPYQFITQAAFVQSLMVYISDNPEKDRDTLKRKKKLQPAIESQLNKLIFRQLFIEERDAELAKIAWNLFDAVAKRWPDAWHEDEPGQILNRTTGFSSLMRFLGPLYRAISIDNRMSSKKIKTVLDRIKIKDVDFNNKKYLPGTSGITKLYRELCDKAGFD